MITPRLTHLLLAAGLLIGSASNLSAQKAAKAPAAPKPPVTKPAAPAAPKPPVPPAASVLTDDTLVITSADNKKVVVHIKRSEPGQSFDSQKLDSLLENLDLHLDEQIEAQIQAALNDQKSGRVIISSEEISPTAKSSNQNEVRVDFDVRKDELRSIIIDDKNDSEGPVRVYINRNGAESDSSKSITINTGNKKKKRYVGGFDIDLGFNQFVNDKRYFNSNGQEANYELRPWGSRYVSLNMYKGARIGGQNSPLQIRSGLNFAFNNYMWEENVYLHKEGQNLDFVQDTIRDFQKSKLAVTTVNVPLNLRLQFDRGSHDDGFMITAGGFVGYRIGSHTKLKFDENGDTKKEKDAGAYNLEEFQYGLNFGIGYHGFELFAKYHLNDLFKEGRGPQTNVIAFGLTI